MAEHEDFRDYSIRIDWNNQHDYDPENEAAEIRLTANGREYMAMFITTGFIGYMFDKNKRTGECAQGTYFCMPTIVVVEKIDEQTVRATIDDLIDNSEIGIYFDEVG